MGLDHPLGLNGATMFKDSVMAGRQTRNLASVSQVSQRSQRQSLEVT